MTNLNKTKEEIIYELVLSLNHGNTSATNDRVKLAIAQYDDLVEKEIIKETTECKHDWVIGGYENTETTFNAISRCTKCNETKVNPIIYY